TDFHRPNQLLRVIRMDLRRGLRLQAFEQAVQRSWAAGLARLQAYAKGFITARQFGQSIQESTQVESRAAHDHRQIAPRGYFRDNPTGQPSVFTSRVTLGRVQHVQQMVTNTYASSGRSFGGTDVEAAIKLERIAVDDLAREFGRKVQSQSAFARSGGSHD